MKLIKREDVSKKPLPDRVLNCSSVRGEPLRRAV